MNYKRISVITSCIAILLLVVSAGAVGIYIDSQQYTSLCDAQSHPDVEYAFAVSEDDDVGILRSDLDVVVRAQGFPSSKGEGSIDAIDWIETSKGSGVYKAQFELDEIGYIIDSNSNEIRVPGEEEPIQIRDCDKAS